MNIIERLGIKRAPKKPSPMIASRADIPTAMADRALRVDKGINVKRYGEEATADYKKLLSLSLTKDVDITSILDRNRTFKCLVGEEYDVYCIKPQPRTSQVQALEKIIQVLTNTVAGKSGEIRIFYVSRTLFESYEMERRQGGKRRSKEEESVSGRVEELLKKAIMTRASDIHIRWRDDDNTTPIYFRIDQMLRLADKVASDVAKQIVYSLFNAYCDDAQDLRLTAPQDGSFFYDNMENRRFMMRLNSLPEKRKGSTVVARLRDMEKQIPTKKAGYSDRMLLSLNRLSAKRQGILPFSGPTNSGKSTSLTALMSELPAHLSVSEVAHPIEFILPNVNHHELKEDTEAEMAKYLSALVRQDLDVLTLGEIRSKTTADTATKMATAGTALLTTIHASSAAAVFSRAEALGMRKIDLASEGFISGTVNQNLMPVLCESCKKPTLIDRSIDPVLLKQKNLNYMKVFEDEIFFRNAYDKCADCGNSGVRGMTLVAEVLEVDDEVRRLVGTDQSFKIPKYMREAKIETKHAHAAGKVLAGLLDPRIIEERIDPFHASHVAYARELAGEAYTNV